MQCSFHDTFLSPPSCLLHCVHMYVHVCVYICVFCVRMRIYVCMCGVRTHSVLQTETSKQFMKTVLQDCCIAYTVCQSTLELQLANAWERHMQFLCILLYSIGSNGGSLTYACLPVRHLYQLMSILAFHLEIILGMHRLQVRWERCCWPRWLIVFGHIHAAGSPFNVAMYHNM